MVACLLFSLCFFINVEASDGGSSSVGIKFYKKAPTISAIKDTQSKTKVPDNGSQGKVKVQSGTNQAGTTRGQGVTMTAGNQLPRTGSQCQVNLSILGLVLIAVAGVLHRKKGQHETNQL